MTSLPKTIRQSELAGRLVILRDTMQELGHVDVVWMHPPVHRVFGFICASGFLGRKKSAFNLPQLHAVGEDGLLVSSAPVPTDAQKVRQIESLVGHEVWSDSGEKIGSIVDYIFDTKTGAIQAYLFTSHPLGALTDGLYRLTPRQMLSYGDRRIRVRDQVLDSPELYKPGLKQRIATVGESVLETAEEEWRSLAEQAVALREQTLERLHSLTDQAKHRAVPLSEQAKEKAQSLSQRAREQGLGFVDRLRDQTRSFTEQLRTEFGETWDVGTDRPPGAPSEEGATSGEYHWETRSTQSEFKDEFADEFEDDWEDTPSAPPPSSATPSALVDEDEDEDEWDTWDLDESDDVTDDLDDVDEFDAVGDSSQVVAPADVPPVAVEPREEDDIPSQDISAEPDVMDKSGVPERDSADSKGAIVSPTSASLPTEPIPLNDLEDDDPWI